METPSTSTDAAIPSSVKGRASWAIPSAAPAVMAATKASGRRQMFAPPSCTLSTPTLTMAIR
jgi:hypothetical protein